jgi:hypothetical protein
MGGQAHMRVVAQAERQGKPGKAGKNGEERGKPVVLGSVASSHRGGGQQAGQMALDVRPWSTCRRLTKAVPVPGMAEAWHDDLDTVQRRP